MPALCADVLLLISDQISPTDRASLRAACKAFDLIVSPSFFQSTPIILDLPPILDNPAHLDVESYSGWSQFGQHLVIRCLGGYEWENAFDGINTPLSQFLTSLKELHSIHWTIHEDDLEWTYPIIQGALLSFTKLRSLSLARHAKARYDPHAFTELWPVLSERGMHLTSLEVPTPDTALLDYLASYSTLESLTFSAAEDKRNVLADRFFADILPRHAGTLSSLICSAKLPIRQYRQIPAPNSNWALSARNAAAISSLTNLKTLEMTVPHRDPVNGVSLLMSTVTTHLPSLREFAALGSAYRYQRFSCVIVSDDPHRGKTFRHQRAVEAAMRNYASVNEGDPEVTRLVESHRARIAVRRKTSLTEMK
ncbi:hypothetical protein FB45DRAFT_1081126 [Roridomyces roridus]|uniref:F-box domain-containing protein n=1 Tax=Roridomyces roridus TaxID=1738132 RepID=A0AAD7AZ37_9AGAR|nr:hypothetical protein FB45DRAFT_1081126 [Roridomyces roridus]